MMANTSLLGVTLPLSPLTMLFGPQVTYALYLGGALAATAGTSYWMLSRHLVRSRAAAFVGGAFLGFAPGIIHHANGQPNFVSNFLLPLIVVRVLRLGEPGRWRRNGLVLGLLVAYQIFINEEMLLLTALACLVVVLAYAVQRPRATRARGRRRSWPRSGVGGGLALLLAAYPIWFQFNGPQSYRGLQGGVFHNWGEDLVAFVTFARDTWPGDPAVEQTIGMTEQNTWFGWPLVLLSVVALVLLVRRSLAARIVAVLIVVFTVAAIGPRVRFNGVETGVDGPWAYVPDDLPLVEMMMPTRLTLVVAAAVGVLLALAWDAAGPPGPPGGCAGPAVPATARRRGDAVATTAPGAAPTVAAPGRVRGGRPRPAAAVPPAAAGPADRPAAALHHRRRLAAVRAGRPHPGAGADPEQRARPADAALERADRAGVPGPGRLLHRPERAGRGGLRRAEPAHQQPHLLHHGRRHGARRSPTRTAGRPWRICASGGRRWWCSARTRARRCCASWSPRCSGPPQRVDDVWLWDVRALVG